MRIRPATPNDAVKLLDIYAPYVTDTAITFEYEVPTLEEFRRRIEHISKKYPYLVAEEDGDIVGYVYASSFKERDAYQWAVETSIYVDKNKKRKGIGRKLHDALEATLKQQGILNLNACIAFLPDDRLQAMGNEQWTSDPYLTLDSVHFHEHMGYQKVAHFHQCGKKFGKWYDMIWMEKIIGDHL